MIIIVKAETTEDLPEDAPWDCMSAVQETLEEHNLTVKDITFNIEG